jgi:anti-repressor protein
MSDLVLVELINNKATTTSLKVANFFGKDHSKVLRDIKAILDKDTESNFGLSEYKDQSGKTNPMYIIDKDGFTLLAMGFTGQKAFQFKKDYIKAFNELESKFKENSLSNPQKQIPQNYIEALKAHLEDQEKILELETKIDRDKDKVEFAETLLDTTNALDMATCAKALHLPYGRNILFDKLRLLNILDRKNRPYQPFVTNGYFVIVESSFVHPKTGDNILTTKTMVTAKGQQYLIKKLKDTGDRI